MVWNPLELVLYGVLLSRPYNLKDIYLALHIENLTENEQ